jgi:hypothetical protein
MLPRSSRALLLTALLVGCSSSGDTGADAGQSSDASTRSDASPKDGTTARHDATAHDAGPMRSGPVAGDSGDATDADFDAEDASADVDAGPPVVLDSGCPTTVPTRPTSCPLPGYGCQYSSEDASVTQCGCGADNVLHCVACPSKIVIGSHCDAVAGVVCAGDEHLCGCVDGKWACPSVPPSSECMAVQISGAPCTTPGLDCNRQGCGNCVCSVGGVWVCTPCMGPLSVATGEQTGPCAGNSPEPTCGCVYVLSEEEVVCDCVNGAIYCMDTF